ncbi:MAG: response regulator [Pyrinomonadaceae bacterium]|nr:response regulator [Pyrinomonadaceae bacterium]
MGTGRKLLLADDSITIQKVVNLTFADEGLEVTTVSNGDLAVEKIEEIAPDIVLADVHMPGLNGYEVCEYVKRSGRFRHIPVMLLVGSFEPFNEAEARRVGADDFLTKPFQSIRQLVSKVSTLLGGGKPAEEDDAPTRDLSQPAPEAHTEAQEQSEAAQPPLAATAPLSAEMQNREAEASRAGARADNFADPVLDDEMIEATPVRDFNANSTATDFNANATIGARQRPTTPLSAADLEEAGINLNQPAVKQNISPPAAINMQDTLRMPINEQQSEDISQESSAPAAPPPQPASSVSTQMSNAAAADDALLDLGEFESPAAAAAADDFVLDIWDDAPARASTSAAAVEYEGKVTEAPPAQVAEFVEAEVVEAEPIIEAVPIEEPDAHEAEEVSAAPPAIEPQAEAIIAEPVSDAGSVTAQPQTGQITLDQLSPEVIDAIARRAVEQLSEKVVEQIAWEVVPQLAELLIKRRLEEEKK